MNTVLGQNLGLFIDNQVLHGSGATSGMVCFAFATNCGLDMNVDAIDITSKDSGSWADSLPNRKSWTISTDCLYSEDYDALMLIAMNRKVFEVQWCTALNTETGNTVTHQQSHNPNGVSGGTFCYFKGNVFIDSISASAGNDEAANYSCTMTGKGKLSVVDKDGNVIEAVEQAINAGQLGA